MLTLNKPIKMIAVSPLSASFDMFSEKVRANYELMTAQISPKELLLLITNPPELPEGQSSITSIAMNINEQNIRSTTLEVVNNVVNRILLVDNPDFTYQDSVYITTVLNKLGITDVNQFVNQVQALKQENTNVYRLSEMYQNNLQLFKKFSNRVQHKTELSNYDQSSEDSIPSKQRYYIHNNIYNRLGTAKIYQIVQSCHNSQSEHINNFHYSELRTAEQLRISRELSLMEIKQQTLWSTNTMLNHVNHYETGDILVPPQTEAQVISRGAAAVLVSLTDNVMVSRIDQILSKRDFWFDFRTAISQSTQNSLMRFQIYHTQQTSSIDEENNYTQEVSQLYNEEVNTVSNFLKEITQLKSDSYVSNLTSESFLHTTKLEYLATQEKYQDLPNEENENKTQVQQNFDAKKLAQVTQQILLGDRPKIGVTDSLKQSADKSQLEYLTKSSPQQLIYQLGSKCFEKIREISDKKTHLIERFEQVNEQKREIYKEILMQRSVDKNKLVEFMHDFSSTVNTENLNLSVNTTNSVGNTEGNKASISPQQLVYQEKTILNEEVKEITSEKIQLSKQINQINEHNNDIISETLIKLPYFNEGETTQIMNEIFPMTNFENPPLTTKGTESIKTDDKKQIPLSPQELVYQKDVISNETIQDNTSVSNHFSEQLNQINERNREIYQEVLAQQKVVKKTHMSSSPDKKKIIQDALRSIEHPEQVMEEILSLDSNSYQNNKEHDNPFIDFVLAHADEATRNIYETILQYENNPEQAIASGKIHHASFGEFEATVREVNKQQIMENEHLVSRDTIHSEVVRDQITNVMEHLQDIPTQENISNNATGYGNYSVPIIHRQQENNISEELLEIFEQQRRQENHQVITNEVVNKETVKQTEINTMNQQTVTHDKEDITEIVNRTLDRQMGTITDRVYSQMERKLQSERSRRGWQ